MVVKASSYRTVRIDGNVAYVKEDRVGLLKEIGGIVFDCDGVLIDASNSYDQAIVETVTFFGERLIAKPFPRNIVSPEFLTLLRESGGFNNDWDTCYAILLTLFSQTSPSIQSRLLGAMAVENNPSTILMSLKAQPSEPSFIPNAKGALMEMAEKADATGIQTVESSVFSSSVSKESLRVFKELLGCPGRVGESILATVFNEYFYGPSLFRQAHGFDAHFYTGRGLIENERLLASPRTVVQLRDNLGKKSLGIASGRGGVATRFTLRELWGSFNSEAAVFIEDEEASSKDVKVGKPEPYALLKAAKAMNGRLILYVGDSTEDFLMAERANRELGKTRFLFAGVYQHSYNPERKMKMFLDKEADLVIPSVDLLPKTLQLDKEA